MGGDGAGGDGEAAACFVVVEDCGVGEAEGDVLGVLKVLLVLMIFGSIGSVSLTTVVGDFFCDDVVLESTQAIDIRVVD